MGRSCRTDRVKKPNGPPSVNEFLPIWLAPTNMGSRTNRLVRDNVLESKPVIGRLPNEELILWND
jgi:hypothetical protein